MLPVELLLLILIGFIFVVVFLTILWRMGVAFDNIALHLSEIVRDLKRLSANIDDKDK